MKTLLECFDIESTKLKHERAMYNETMISLITKLTRTISDNDNIRSKSKVN